MTEGEDIVTGRLEAMVREACGELPVVFGPPEREKPKTRVFLAFVGLMPNLMVRNDSRQPLQLFRRYLACVTSPNESESMRHLEALMFQVMQTAGIEVEPEGIPSEYWATRGIPLEASFVLRLAVTLERNTERTPPPQKVEFDLTPTGTLKGRLEDESGFPVAKCTVEIPSRKLQTKTDASGGFEFPLIARNVAYQIRVRLDDKTEHLFASIGPGSGFVEPIVVKLPAKGRDA